MFELHDFTSTYVLHYCKSIGRILIAKPQIMEEGNCKFNADFPLS